MAAGEDNYQVNLYSRDPSEGSIEYLQPKSVLDRFEGFFSFTFYIRDRVVSPETTPKSSRLYLEGLSAYASVIQHPPFTNWGLFIYTDQFTLDQMTQILGMGYKEEEVEQIKIKEIIRELRANRGVTFVKVTWPKHQRRPAIPQINGPVLRSFRSRAPFDFPTKMIFIRDADTLFDPQLKNSFTLRSFRNKETFKEKKPTFQRNLLKWEATLLGLMPQIQEFLGGRPPLVVSTGNTAVGVGMAPELYYKRDWHSNELTRKNAPFGIFAGFVNVAPNVPVYATPEAWDIFVDYMNAHSRRINEIPSSAFEQVYRKEQGIKDPFQAVEEKNLNENIRRKVNREQPQYREKKLESFLQERGNIVFRFSDNNKSPHQVGRDEQLYLFILMPRAIDNLFVFKQALWDMDLPKLDLDYHTDRIRNYRAALARNFLAAPAAAGANQGGKRRQTRRKMKKSKSTRKH
jgi:hypothetical protein